jgi:anthranilate phosphoribosyltransferase
MDGMDEVTLTDRSRVSEGKAGLVTSYLFEPADIGLARVRPKELLGGTAAENAVLSREILNGRKGPKRDVVCLNAGLALVAGGKARTIREGYELAGKVVDSGAAAEKLEKLIEVTNR